MKATVTPPAAPQSATSPSRHMTVKQFAETHHYPTIRALRWLLFSNKDGFRQRCAKQIGKRIVLDESAVIQWIDDHSAIGQN